MSSKIRTAVIGASGYTGAEMVRLGIRHPNIELVALTADRKAGQSIGDVFPHLDGLGLPDLIKLDDLDIPRLDVAVCCLPHATTQEVVKDLPKDLRIIDLSADFRLRDVQTYADWYGHDHLCPELQDEAAYGLTEIYRDDVADKRIIACPGCYPTSAQLPLIPLVQSGLIETTDIIIDAKTGVSGGGRGLKENLLFAECGEALSAYGIASHRHAPEIEQGLAEAAGQGVTVNFTPHLAPMARGILATCYVKLTKDHKARDLRECLAEFYGAEPFVMVLGEGKAPSTAHVRGSNSCRIGVFDDRIEGRAIVLSAIDNLVKGSSGQAIQNLNVAFGLEETTGLEQAPLFP